MIRFYLRRISSDSDKSVAESKYYNEKVLQFWHEDLKKWVDVPTIHWKEEESSKEGQDQS